MRTVTGPRRSEEGGFTLVELLVVILIIGVLVAIAIPAFLNQTAKATDSGAKELAWTASTAAETYETDHQGRLTGLDPTALAALEATIPTAPNDNAAYLTDAVTPAAAGTSTGTNTAGQSYSVTITSGDGNTYTIARNNLGVFTRTCASSPGARGGGCVGGSW